MRRAAMGARRTSRPQPCDSTRACRAISGGVRVPVQPSVRPLRHHSATRLYVTPRTPPPSARLARAPCAPHTGDPAFRPSVDSRPNRGDPSRHAIAPHARDHATRPRSRQSRARTGKRGRAGRPIALSGPRGAAARYHPPASVERPSPMRTRHDETMRR